ncbi:MAG: gamma-glutamyl-phosphate reductase, partial [Coriobacteriales bacterium]|nr:gamma-glutamyl-phosphate reductase [Coriobacteriales bacterium]
MSEVLTKARQARTAASLLARLDATARNRALLAMADALQAQTPYLLEENALDVTAARKKGTEESLIDRLLLT